ncbi:MAG TPA: VWA domain-containing protein, partial [Vicinamibacterales bacterium]|nr:VWA domain-containing protein [Vicinamibacterales bacterium]
MRAVSRRQAKCAFVLALTMAGVVAKAQDQRKPDFTSRVELVTTDVVVRDNTGQFIADLKKDDFEVLEDGVPQKVVSFSLTHGGRSYNIAAPPPAPVAEGILLPPARPATDAAGRIFFIFVDDLHLDFRNTGRIRDLFKKISEELVHEGDMFGIVSTGPSSIAIDLTYDRRRLAEAIKKISGAGLAPKDILDVPQGQQGPPEVRHRAHVAFSTATDMMRQLEQVHNRRKAFIYVSNGYDLDPFAKTRAKNEAERYGQLRSNVDNSDGSDGGSVNPNDPTLRNSSNQFAFADLVSDLAEVTRAANRANTTIYTIDPRGLVGGPDLDEKIDMMEYLDYVRSSQDSLRVLADLTGGLAVVNQNDFTKALKRIDQETSDYYVVGYYSSNPDPTKKRRSIEVKVKRAGANVWNRTSYTLKTPGK